MTITLALVLGIVSSTWQARDANRARQRADQLRLKAEKNHYASDMLWAFGARSRGLLGHVRELLAKHSPHSPSRSSKDHDFRGWEWRHLWEYARGDDALKLLGHTNAIVSALFLPDGRTVFSASYDRTLRFWDIETRAVTATVTIPDQPRRPVISPNGQMIAVDGMNGYWSVFDSRERRQIYSATNANPVLGSAFSPDNQFLALSTATGITILDVNTWQIVKRVPKRYPLPSGPRPP